MPLTRLRVVDAPLQDWGEQFHPKETATRLRLARQNVAIGSSSDARLAAASIAVIGVSGGGSHVCQQLAHQGVGRILPIDDQLVEEVQLGRMVGAKRWDANRSHKTAVMRRLITGIDPDIVVEEVRQRFPAREALEAIKSADLVISCVDSFFAREQINRYCRRQLLPLIDIGMRIRTSGERLIAANGQLIVVLPDSPCLSCTPLLSDQVLARERNLLPPGYDENPKAPGDPQVVSMNGVLASEAANSALDLITGYAGGARGAGWWLYDGRAGTLVRANLPARRPACPACAEQGHGDPHNFGP